MNGIGSRIRQVRKLYCITAETFGKKIGVKKNSISQYETGRTNVTDRSISLICKEFGVDEHWLRTGEGEMFKDNTQETNFMAEIGELFSDQSPRIRKELMQIIATVSPEELAAGYNICKKVIEAAHGIKLEDLPEDFFD